MTKYLLKRLIRGLLSIIVVVAIVMILIYSFMDKNAIFSRDTVYTHMANNQKKTYTYNKWEEYGYLDYVPYADWLLEQNRAGKISDTAYDAAILLGRTAEDDSKAVATYVKEFENYYKKQGYHIVRLNAVVKKKTSRLEDGGAQALFAYKAVPLSTRLWDYFSGIIHIDNIHKAKYCDGERKITFTLYDPVYGGNKFSPAIIGNGTEHKYLAYCDNKFPFIHQNMLTVKLGTSYSINKGKDFFETVTQSQGIYTKQMVYYPTGLTEMSADNLHSATYAANSLATSQVYMDRFVDDYTTVTSFKDGNSKMGYSFLIGIISVIVSYFLAVPLGIIMARRKDKFLDKLGTVYIVFITAVPSLAYIFLFKAIGGKMGLPTTFDIDSHDWMIYILPVVSLALPSISSIMKWLRRYMIDQMNSDYVKFARSGGLTENEIFTKHIFKNAVIPLVHGIPASILSCMTGALITERVYSVPGTGGLFVNAINAYDNGVIVGVTFFYAILTVVSMILGDALMAMVDPRISFSEKAR